MFLFSYSHDACIGELERAFAANHPMTTGKTPPARPSRGASLTPTRPPLLTPQWATVPINPVRNPVVPRPTIPVEPMEPAATPVVPVVPVVPMGPPQTPTIRGRRVVPPRYPVPRQIAVVPPPVRTPVMPPPSMPTPRRVHPPPRMVQPPVRSCSLSPELVGLAGFASQPHTPRTVAMGQGLLAYVAVYIYMYTH